jgi:hypothetical protein
VSVVEDIAHRPKTVLGAHIASAFDSLIQLKNIILLALRIFEFSHSLLAV